MAQKIDSGESEVPDVIDSSSTTCCVVGGGPAGAVLSLILARQGIPVTLLEAHEDFDRDFRGDTIHPSVLHIMDELGLAERLLQLRHSKIHTVSFSTPNGLFTMADFRRVEEKFPYIMMVPQEHFLEFITDEAKKHPAFELRMGASVQELIEEGDQVKGVRYRTNEGWHELRSTLVIGADGRSSRVRKLADVEMIKTSPPMDVLWFRIPREPEDPTGVLAQFGRGHALVLLDRLTQWQVGFVILKGTWGQIRSGGLEQFRAMVKELMTEFPDRIEHLTDWKQVSVLSVESSRVTEWTKPGLLLIGDAAHVMSPVGGVGINYAIQDAVVAANVIVKALESGTVSVEQLREVQKQREFPTKVIQWVQMQVQKRIIAAALNSSTTLQVPPLIRLLLKFPIIRNLPARLLAHSVRTVHVEVGNESV